MATVPTGLPQPEAAAADSSWPVGAARRRNPTEGEDRERRALRRQPSRWHNQLCFDDHSRSDSAAACTGHAATGRGTSGFNRKIEAQRALAAEKERPQKGATEAQIRATWLLRQSRFAL